MFDYLRSLRKSAAEKQQEQLNAYLDGELPAGEARRFEAKIEQDPALKAELTQLQQVKQGLQQLPQVRAPRNYTLDPAVYGTPAPQPAVQWLPAVRVATALAAFFFVLVVALDLFSVAGQAPLRSQAGQEAEMADIAVEEEIEEQEEAVAEAQMDAEMAEEPVAEEEEAAAEAPAALVPAPTGDAAEGAAADRPEAIEAAEEEDTGPAAETGLADEAATAAEAGEGLTEATTVAGAEIEAKTPPVVATQLPGRDEAETSEESPVVVEPLPSLSPLRIAQIVLGLLLAGLMVTWALIRQD